MTNIEVTGAAVPRFSRREIAEFARTVLLTLEKLDKLKDEITEASIAFVDDDAMTTLNRQFRKKNRTTDVLTFPADDSYNEPAKAQGRPLGDIVISVDQARRQAADEKHSLATEIRYLILHGILHALGYDHETDSGEMNALEVEVRAAIGLE
ncbi:MAG: rRNA maturation RNase YbeY [Acidobacteria bacterium]|nr:rRNA maturation RNase YbeY [Acidobacteriota bacterium]MBV9476140.1 rRNA maturation RNase YbeY [Acidobacteriota bacterium]